ncbi:hypothetical protein ACOME3_000724 [Neoechinorhynchus agilis]
MEPPSPPRILDDQINKYSDRSDRRSFSKYKHDFEKIYAELAEWQGSFTRRYGRCPNTEDIEEAKLSQRYRDYAKLKSLYLKSIRQSEASLEFENADFELISGVARASPSSEKSNSNMETPPPAKKAKFPSSVIFKSSQKSSVSNSLCLTRQDYSSEDFFASCAASNSRTKKMSDFLFLMTSRFIHPREYHHLNEIQIERSKKYSPALEFLVAKNGNPEQCSLISRAISE